RHGHDGQPGDPHSAVVFGLRRVLFEGYELYSVAANDAQTLKNYGRGTPQDWLERRLYSAYPHHGIVVFVAAHLVLFGVPGILMIAVHLVAQPFFAGGVINGLGHAVGYRSFEMPSTATNLVPWALLLGGEELHNNHHAFPRSARFSVQRWEIDIGWLWIRLFDALGLAKVRWVAPRPHFERRRRDLDADTVNALFVNRMHVLRDYARRVVLPVCRELARREGRGMPVSAPKLLIRHPALLAEEARRKLRELLERYEALRGDALEILQVRHYDPQQIIVFPGHEIALHDLGHLAHRALEGLESRLALAIERNAHEHVRRKPRLVLVDERGVALDEPGLLERPHPAQAGRLRQAHLVRQACVGDPGILLQQA